jgi:hypothetical protein
MKAACCGMNAAAHSTRVALLISVSTFNGQLVTSLNCCYAWPLSVKVVVPDMTKTTLKFI